MRAPRKLVGKIIEIKLSIGYVYGLCTQDLKTSGQVIQLYKGLYEDHLNDPLSALDAEVFRMAIKFPLKYVLKEPEINIVADRPLQREEATLPIFRSLGLAARGEVPAGWWIIDGDKETWVEGLKPEMAHYPDDGIYNLMAIEELYTKDLYPHSPELLERGPLKFSISRLQ